MPSRGKPRIATVATGGTIANTRSGRIPIQEVIADIRKNYGETNALLDSVDLEVISGVSRATLRFSWARW